MSLVGTRDNIVEYPETDGQPMAETDLHRNWMIRICDQLGYRYRERRVYVASNLMLYYEEGNPLRSIVPDDFVVLECEPRDRRVFKTWEEGKSPNVVFEVTSRSTRRQDTVFKPQVYGEIGVREYFVYDPTGDYLLPPLQGFRMQAGGYAKIEAGDSGTLECRELGLVLRVEAGRLVMYDAATGEPLRTEAEAERLARQKAEAQAAQEADARRAAEARAAAAEHELRLLRAELDRERSG